MSLGLALTLSCVSAALAQPAPMPSPAPAPVDGRALLKQLEQQGHAYGDARRALSSGRPEEALKLLKARDATSILADREALLRGDALLALGQKVPAKDAYQLAHDQAKNEAVRARAARGLVAALGQLGDRAGQLAAIDELLADKGVPRRPALLLERAVVLDQLDRDKEAADVAWRLMSDYPMQRVADEARALLERLKKQGTPAPVSSARVELSRVARITGSAEPSPALAALDALEKAQKGPPDQELLDAIALERAEVYGKLKNRTKEIELLTKLVAKPLDDETKLDVLDRLGRAYLAIGDHAQATRWFGELKAAFPRKTRTVEAQYLALWSSYNEGRFAEAASGFLAHADDFRRWRRRPEALWFAGWSAYRGGDDALARRALEQLLVDHPTSDLVLWAHYWIGRTKERSKDLEGAKAAYRNVLRIAPLAYQASWAATRLEKLGERVVIGAPKGDGKPASLTDVVAMLGPTRPVGIDRGIALHRVGLEGEAMEELDATNSELAKLRDTRSRVMIAEMLESLGAHHQAYRFATQITQSGADLVTGEPYAWRAWRMAYPKAFEAEVKNAAAAHGIDPLLLLSIMRTESSFRPTAKSPVGARGLMQLMPATAKQIGRKAPGAKAHAGRFTEPASNVWLGAWYLKQLLDRYGGNLAMAAGAYNAGPGAMDRWVQNGRDLELDAFVETISYRETRHYVRKVLESYQVYRRLDAAPELDLTGVVAADLPRRESTVTF